MLRRHFGISAREYLDGLEVWEIELLLTGLEQEHAQEAEMRNEIG